MGANIVLVFAATLGHSYHITFLDEVHIATDLKLIIAFQLLEKCDGILPFDLRLHCCFLILGLYAINIGHQFPV